MWHVIADLLLLNLAFIISRVVDLLDLRNMLLEIRAQRERHEKESAVADIRNNEKGE